MKENVTRIVCDGADMTNKETWFTGKVIAGVIAEECPGASAALQKDWARRIDDAVEYGRTHALDEALSIVNKHLRNEISASKAFDEIKVLMDADRSQ